MVLGVWSRKGTLYGEGISVVGTGDLAEQLQGAIARLPSFATFAAFPRVEAPPAVVAPPPLEQHISEGSFFLDDHSVICQLTNGQAVPVQINVEVNFRLY